jgi:hypothetical protein
MTSDSNNEEIEYFKELEFDRNNSMFFVNIHDPIALDQLMVRLTCLQEIAGSVIAQTFNNL